MTRSKAWKNSLNVYYQSVGGNSTFLLNLPPDTRGLIHENDVTRLAELGQILRSTFGRNLASDAHAAATETLNETHNVNRILDGNQHTFWCPKEGTEHAEIEIDLNSEHTFDTIILKEHIQSGQRIEKLRIEYQHEGSWVLLCEYTVVGYKRICRFPEATARFIRLMIEESRWCPTLSAFEVYCSPRGFE